MNKSKGNILAIIAGIMQLIKGVDIIARYIWYFTQDYMITVDLWLILFVAGNIVIGVSMILMKRNALFPISLGMVAVSTIVRLLQNPYYQDGLFWLPEVILEIAIVSLFVVSIVVVVRKGNIAQKLWLLPTMLSATYLISDFLINFQWTNFLYSLFTSVALTLMSIWFIKFGTIGKNSYVEPKLIISVPHHSENAKCDKCGAEIPKDSIFCPACGVAQNSVSAMPNITKGKISKIIQKINPKGRLGISIALIIAAAVFVIIGITNLTSDDYSFYKEHYKDCMDGYKECIEKSEAGWYKSTYESLANDFKKMADDDLAKIVGLTVGTIILFVLAGLFIVVTFFLLPSKAVLKLSSSHAINSSKSEMNFNERNGD